MVLGCEFIDKNSRAGSWHWYFLSVQGIFVNEKKKKSLPLIAFCFTFKEIDDDRCF